MGFPNICITNVGRQFMSHVFNGERMQFTHFSIGCGECVQEQWKDRDAPVEWVMDVNISDYKRDGDAVTLHGEFTTSNVENEFWWRELCIYAKLQDVEDAEEVMCFYGNAESLAEFVPSLESSVNVTHRWDTSIKMDSNADITAVVHSVTYATNEQLNKHTMNSENPHKVTKDQIGLGNVPNVYPQDQEPEFSMTVIEAVKDKNGTISLDNIRSGEKMGSILQKIRSFFDLIINHLNGKNPHKLNASDVGAAASTHYHNASNINAGVLSISRGGTGASTTEEAVKKLGAMPAKLLSENLFVSSWEQIDSELTKRYNLMTNQSSKFINVRINGTFYELHVWRATELYGYAEMKGYFGARECRREMYDGVWTGWEFYNPMLSIGNEYRTTEHWLNANVYKKLVHIGKLSIGSNYIKHDITCFSVLKAEIFTSNSGKYCNITNYHAVSAVWADGQNIRVNVISEIPASDNNCYCLMTYTKT